MPTCVGEVSATAYYEQAFSQAKTRRRRIAKAVETYSGITEFCQKRMRIFSWFDE